MTESYNKIKGYILDLNYAITAEDEENGVILISHEEDGINNMALGCSPPILIMEQHILDLKSGSEDIFKSLLMKNRDMIHGAFVLDETGKKVIFRDTLQVENLDLNEIEASINSLSLLLSEYSEELIKFSKN